jgi:SpoVK/Ycf46/Vps4 family AAA+-type ATPase
MSLPNNPNQSSALHTFAQEVVPADDHSILAPVQVKALCELAAQAKSSPQRSRPALIALFAGSDQTSKLTAASFLASQLQLSLFRIDLAAVVSKFIGETEKNLDAVFSAAGASRAILFFDEADALFGKRSEVKDAHDRFANIEINFLLQQIEQFRVIAILATNAKPSLPPDWLRLVHTTLRFPPKP